jgi:serine/threonine-protein kinase
VTGIPEALAAALQDRYVLERELGRGGMATVYLAHDVRHDRPVALKVLHREIAASLGPDRFKREIHVAAQLQHPHILPLHDSGEAAACLYYVMPYVEGESLRERLARDGELPVPEAVRLLCEITDALAYAHARGVVHRDIKPDNIMLAARHALILDLGIAKAVSEAGAGREVLTTAGVALGTPRYMAPEQAVADPHIDHRVDVYAVGVMAYEMLSGAPPFAGSTPQAVIAAHVTQQPIQLDVIRPGVSPQLSQIVAKCLAKRPSDRWQSAAELLAKLESLASTSGETIAAASALTPAAGRQAAPSRGRRTRGWLIGGGAVAAIAAALTIALAGRSAPEIRFGARSPVTVDPGLEIDPAVSPDGRFVAYAAGTLAESRVYVRQVDGGAAVAIAGDLPAGQRLPYWSPDGRRILFRSPRGIEIVSALGGPSRTVVPARGGAILLPGPWSPDGRQLAFARSDSLYVMPAIGGPPRLVAYGGDMHSFVWSPDGRWIAGIRGNRQSIHPSVRWFFGNLGASAVWLFPTGGGEPVQITDDHSFAASPLWMPRGRELLFLSNAEGGLDVYQVPLRSNGRPASAPRRITTGLNARAMSLAADGRRMVYEVFTETSNVWSVPIPTGSAIDLAQAEPVTRGNQVIETFDLSPDGRWLTFDSDRAGGPYLYRAPISGGEPQLVTSDSGAHFWPRWSPGGQEIVYHVFRHGQRRLFLVSAEGGQPTPVSGAEGDDRSPEWDRQGAGLYYLHDFDTPDAEIRYIGRDRLGRWGTPRRIARIDALPVAVSPDGRRLAFSSNKGLMLTTAVGESARVILPVSYRASELRPTYVSWSQDGRRLYYLALDSLDRASIWSIAPTGGTPTLLVRFDRPDREWHRYGFVASRNRFYFTLGDRQSDIWVTQLEESR